MTGATTDPHSERRPGVTSVENLAGADAAYTMTILPGNYGGNRPTWGVECGQLGVVARTFPAAEMARVLVAGGREDGPWRIVDAVSGRVRVTGRSLHGVARLTVSDADGGPRPTGGGVIDQPADPVSERPLGCKPHR